MKLTDIKTFVVGNPPPHYGGRYFVFVKLVTDNGIEGIGEVYAATFHPSVVERMVWDVFQRHVEGADPFRIEALWRKMYAQTRQYGRRGIVMHVDKGDVAALAHERLDQPRADAGRAAGDEHPLATQAGIDGLIAGRFALQHPVLSHYRRHAASSPRPATQSTAR